MIEITAENMERAEKLLAGIPGGAERAAVNAVNRGLSHLKTESFKEVREIYDIKPSALNNATTTSVTKAGGGNLIGSIRFSGYKIPLFKFKATPTSPGTGRKVRAGQLKGGGEVFQHAFIAQFRSGHTGIFDRLGKKRTPVEEIMGTSAAQMIADTRVFDKLTEEAQKKVDERLEHEISRIINGYGG